MKQSSINLSSINFLEDCYEAGGADQFICYTEWSLARQLHKQEIMEAFYEGMRCQNYDPNIGRAEQYYNETFNAKDCQFYPKMDTTSATICANCGREKFEHNL